MKPRIYTLGTLEAKDNDGLDMFAVIKVNRPIAFQKMLDGFEVVEKKTYDRAIREISRLKKLLKKV